MILSFFTNRYYALYKKADDRILALENENWALNLDIENVKKHFNELEEYESYTEYSLKYYGYDNEWKVKNITEQKQRIRDILSIYSSPHD